MNIEILFKVTNIMVGSGVLLGLIGATLLYYFSLKRTLPDWIFHTILIIFSLGVFILPQVYEQIFGLPPCYLCWLQRICTWPVAILTPLAIYRKQLKLLIPYFSILLSLGTVIGLYHYSLQFGVAPVTIACGAVGQSVSCGGIEVLVFDFLTIPLMAVIANVSVLLVYKAYTKK